VPFEHTFINLAYTVGKVFLQLKSYLAIVWSPHSYREKLSSFWSFYSLSSVS